MIDTGLIIVLNSMSGLWGPQSALDLYLQEEGITTLLFAGVNADQVRPFQTILVHQHLLISRSAFWVLLSTLTTEATIVSSSAMLLRGRLTPRVSVAAVLPLPT